MQITILSTALAAVFLFPACAYEDVEIFDFDSREFVDESTDLTSIEENVGSVQLADTTCGCDCGWLICRTCCTFDDPTDRRVRGFRAIPKLVAHLDENDARINKELDVDQQFAFEPPKDAEPRTMCEWHFLKCGGVEPF